MPSREPEQPPQWLDQREARAWYGYRRMTLLVNAQVAKELSARSGLSEPDYDVLSALTDSANASVRVGDLAAHMLWSRSRLSHHISRMETRGLVTRESCAEDGRGAIVHLTDAGRRAIEAAAPGHVASVRRHVFDHLTRAEVDALARITAKVVEAFADTPPPDSR